jgi:cell division protease FtsH
MSPKVGPLNYSDGETGMFAQRPYGEATAQLIDDEIRRIAEECQADAEKLLGDHRSQLDALAQALLKNDSLDESQILEVTGIKVPANVAAAKAANGQPVPSRSTRA